MKITQKKSPNKKKPIKKLLPLSGLILTILGTISLIDHDFLKIGRFYSWRILIIAIVLMALGNDSEDNNGAVGP